MSLKEDIVYIKKEVDTEEQFLSGMAHAEKFWKKYKKPLVGIAAAFVLGVSGVYGYGEYSNMQIKAANEALNRLFINPSDTDALATLERKDKKLYDAYMLFNSSTHKSVGELEKLSSSKTMFVAELALYQEASLNKDAAKLSTIGDDKNSIMRDLALIDLGVLALQNKDAKAANTAFAKVGQNSMAKPEAVALEHFGASLK